MGGSRAVDPRQNLVAGLVSHSGHVGRCGARYDHFRDDVEVACRTGKETQPRRCPQNSQGVAYILENHARDEDRSNGRSVNGHTESCPLPPLAALVRRRDVRLVKTAWRCGYHGLACVIAVAWDTQFSPVDVRTLRGRHKAIIGGRLVFDRQADGRTKTGRAAIGTLSVRTEQLVNAYYAELQIDLHPDGVLFRTRTGNAYGRDILAHDFAAVRALAFPGDNRRLMDMRRSGVVEAVAGDAGPLGLAAKLANSIGRSNALHKTYAPVDIEAVRNTDAARLRGRRRMRAENESGAKVSKK